MSNQLVIATFWNRRWLILTTTLAAVIGGLCWAQGLPHVYNSSVVLVAKSKDGSSIPSERGGDLRQEFWRQLWSQSVIYPVVQSELFEDRRTSGATDDMLIERIKQSTSLIEEHQGSTVALRLYYYDLTPEKAQTIVDRMGKAIDSSEGRSGSEYNVVFRVVQSATPAVGPIKPRLFVVTVFAFGGGLLLGVVLAVISELVSTRRREKFNSPSVPVSS